MNHTYELASPGGLGYKQILSPDKEKSLSGEVTFTANLFVEKVEIYSEGADDSDKLGSSLFCARLTDWQDDFTSSIDKLYSKAHFFSEGFRMSLARELKASRGGLDCRESLRLMFPLLCFASCVRNWQARSETIVVKF